VTPRDRVSRDAQQSLHQLIYLCCYVSFESERRDRRKKYLWLDNLWAEIVDRFRLKERTNNFSPLFMLHRVYGTKRGIIQSECCVEMGVFYEYSARAIYVVIRFRFAKVQLLPNTRQLSYRSKPGKVCTHVVRPIPNNRAFRMPVSMIAISIGQ